MQAYYYAMIKQIDDQFQRVLDHLEASGQLDNTVIIFTSDHGESLGDHDVLQKGCRLRRVCAHSAYSLWPGKFLQNVQRKALVELLDLTSTIVELAGLEQPAYMQGKSLIPLLTDATQADEHREFVRSEYFDALTRSSLTEAARLPLCTEIANTSCRFIMDTILVSFMI